MIIIKDNVKFGIVMQICITYMLWENTNMKYIFFNGGQRYNSFPENNDLIKLISM